MANRYSNYIVNGGTTKPGFRPMFEDQLGCANIHDLKKQDFIEIALNWDAANAPLFMDDPDIKSRASQAQKDALYAEVDARRRMRQAQAAGAKRATQGGKKATAESGQAQRAKRTTVRSKKDKPPVKDEGTTPSDDEAAEQTQDGDVRMTDDEDGAEAAPTADAIADAASSLHGGKRKRRSAATPAANKRTRTARSELAEEEDSQELEDSAEATAIAARPTRAKKQIRGRTQGRLVQDAPPSGETSLNQSHPVTTDSLIVKLKVGSGLMQTMSQVHGTDGDRNMAPADGYVQGASRHQSQKQTARNMQTTNTRQTLKQPAPRRQRGVKSSLEPKKSMEGDTNNRNDAVVAADNPGGASETSASERVPGKLPGRRKLPWIKEDKANVSVEGEPTAADEASDEIDETDDMDEIDEAPSEDVESNASSSEDNEEPTYVQTAPAKPGKLIGPTFGEKLSPEESAKQKGHKGWPKDKDGNPRYSGTWNGKMVDYLKEETLEDEAKYPMYLLSGPAQMRRLERQERRAIAAVEARGEKYVPPPIKKEYDWTEHMDDIP